MIDFIHKKQSSLSYKILCGFIALTFLTSVVLPPSYAQSVLNLPVPGTMVAPSAGFMPARLIGVTVHPDNPLQFDFIVNSGDTDLSAEDYKEESRKLIKYFLASLTVPEDELWVNLSPYEKDRMIPQGLGATEMGRDMLAQDYLLKQLTASLMYPEKELGKKFWDKIYKEARAKYGTTEIPVNTFNKVWVVPQDAVVYEQDTSAYVVKSRLKVMLENDYQAMSHQSSDVSHQSENLTTEDGRLTTQIIKEVIIPAIEKEVNEGENFANLRQMYNSLILAAWYKLKLKDGLLGKVYVDQNKTKGIDTQDKQINQKIYDQYIESFKKGVYNYIKEDTDPATQDVIPRKYFSGGLGFGKGILAMVAATLLVSTPASAAGFINEINNGKNDRIEIVLGENPLKSVQETVIALEPSLAIVSSPVKKGKDKSVGEAAKTDTKDSKKKQIVMKIPPPPMSQKAKIAAMLRHKIAPGGQLIPAADPSRRDQIIQEVNINLRKQIVGGLTRQTEFIMVIGELIPTFQDADLNLRFARLIMPSLDRPVGIAEFHPAAYKNFLTVVLQALNKLVPAIQDESFKQELRRKMMEGRRLVIQLLSEIAARERQEEAKKIASSSPVSSDIRTAKTKFDWNRESVNRALDELPQEFQETLKGLNPKLYAKFKEDVQGFRKNSGLTNKDPDDLEFWKETMAQGHIPNALMLSRTIGWIKNLGRPDMNEDLEPLRGSLEEFLISAHQFLNTLIDQHARFQREDYLLIQPFEVNGQKYFLSYGYEENEAYSRHPIAHIMVADETGEELLQEPFGGKFVSEAISELYLTLVETLSKTGSQDEIAGSLKSKLAEIKERMQIVEEIAGEKIQPAVWRINEVGRQMLDILTNPSHYGSAPGMPGATELLIWSQDPLNSENERAQELISEMTMKLDLPVASRDVGGSKQMYIGLFDPDDVNDIFEWLMGKEQSLVSDEDTTILNRMRQSVLASAENPSVLVWVGEAGSRESGRAHEIVARILEEKRAKLTARDWEGLQYLYINLPDAADARAELRQWMEEIVIFEDGLSQFGQQNASSPVGDTTASSTTLAKLLALKDRNLEYGLQGGRLSKENIPIYEALRVLLSSDLEEGEAVTNTLARMREGDLTILFLLDVLSEKEKDILIAKDAQALGRLSQKEQEALLARLKAVVDSYASLAVTRKGNMLKRLVPMSVIKLLESHFDISYSDTIFIITAHPNYPIWLPKASEKVSGIKDHVGGKSNAWHIVIGQGLEKVDDWILRAGAKVDEIKDRVGGETKAWLIVMNQGLEKVDDWILRAEAKVDEIKDRVGGETKAWSIVISQGLEKIDNWVLRAEVKAEGIKDRVGGKSNAWLIIIGQGIEKVDDWILRAGAKVDEIKDRVGGERNAWLIIIGQGIEKVDDWILRAESKVDEIKDRVGGERNAWHIVNRQGLEQVDDWIVQAESTVEKLINSGIPETTAWRKVMETIFTASSRDPGGRTSSSPVEKGRFSKNDWIAKWGDVSKQVREVLDAEVFDTEKARGLVLQIYLAEFSPERIDAERKWIPELDKESQTEMIESWLAWKREETTAFVQGIDSGNLKNILENFAAADSKIIDPASSPVAGKNVLEYGIKMALDSFLKEKIPPEQVSVELFQGRISEKTGQDFVLEYGVDEGWPVEILDALERSPGKSEDFKKLVRKILVDLLEKRIPLIAGHIQALKEVNKNQLLNLKEDIGLAAGNVRVRSEVYIKPLADLLERYQNRRGELQKASSPVLRPPGGIDLNPTFLDLQIKRDGNGVPLPLPQQPIETMHIDGFVPIIINITPIPNLLMLLGLADTAPDTQQAKPDLKVSPKEPIGREVESISLLN